MAMDWDFACANFIVQIESPVPVAVHTVEPIRPTMGPRPRPSVLSQIWPIIQRSILYQVATPLGMHDMT